MGCCPSRGLGEDMVLVVNDRHSQEVSPSSPNYYIDASSIWEALSRTHGSGVPEVRLLRATWLVEYARSGRGPMRRRQELEEAAFLPLAELRAMKTGPDGQLPLVAVSYAYVALGVVQLLDVWSDSDKHRTLTMA